MPDITPAPASLLEAVFTPIPELMRDLASMGQLVKLPTRRERAFPRVVKERPWKYPTAPKKSQSVA